MYRIQHYGPFIHRDPMTHNPRSLPSRRRCFFWAMVSSVRMINGRHFFKDGLWQTIFLFVFFSPFCYLYCCCCLSSWAIREALLSEAFEIPLARGVPSSAQLCSPEQFKGKTVANSSGTGEPPPRPPPSAAAKNRIISRYLKRRIGGRWAWRG